MPGARRGISGSLMGVLNDATGAVIPPYRVSEALPWVPDGPTG